MALLLLSGAGLGQAQSDEDMRLTGQLREAFRQVEGLERVTLEVRGRVVVLSGLVSSFEASKRAEELAARLPGVLTVANGIKVEPEINPISPAFNKLRIQGEKVLAYLPMFLLAGLVMLFAAWLSRRVASWKSLYGRLTPNVFLQDLTRQFVAFLTFLVGVLVALELLQATALLGAVLGTAGILGVALGFAFRDVAENGLASIMLSLRQPFAPNDFVAIDGHEGTVVRLTSRATVLLTLSGNHLRIPNSTVFKALIMNYTRNPERRFSFALGVGTQEDLLGVQELVVETLHGAPGVLADPPPACRVESLGDWTVKLMVLGWVDQRSHSYFKVRGEAIRLVKEALDLHQIAMPEPIYTIHTQQKAPPDKPAMRSQAQQLDLSPETHLSERVLEERSSAEQSDFLEPEALLE